MHEWQHEARCRGLDPALFFDAEEVEAARACCASCPVAVPCLLDALVTEPAGVRYGIRGGLLGAERGDLMRRRGGVGRRRIGINRTDAQELLELALVAWRAGVALPPPAHREGPVRPCQVCGEPFVAAKLGTERVYCSQACSSRSNVGRQSEAVA